MRQGSGLPSVRGVSSNTLPAPPLLYSVILALRCGYSRMGKRMPDTDVVPALHKYWIRFLLDCSTAEHNRKHGRAEHTRASLNMTVALLRFGQGLLRTSRNATTLQRTFHASLPRRVVRPFLLSDIGEGENRNFS